MAKTRRNPRNSKICVFCKYWSGDADMKFINSTVGYEYELTASGKCMKKNVTEKTHCSCSYYEPSYEAEKLL